MGKGQQAGVSFAVDTAAPEGIDPHALQRLLQIASPEDGLELLRRLKDDLATAAAALEQDMITGNRAGLRSGSHVLIALAGSIGAKSLEAEARALNTTAHDADAPLSVALMQSLTVRLADLRAHVAEVAAATAGRPGA